jgi:hypothetical protein
MTVQEQSALLTTGEQELLERHEHTIEHGLQTFYAVGSALVSIRDLRLYRATHGTFEDYCTDRWGIKRAHAYRLIDASEVIDDLRESPIGDGDNPMPVNEAQARPLGKLPAEERGAAWHEAVERSGGKPTARVVEQVVQERRQALKDPPILPPGWYWQESSNPDDIIAINRNRHDQISGFCASHKEAADKAWQIHKASQGAAPEPPPDKNAFENVMRGALADSAYERIGTPEESERVTREHMLDLQARGYFFSHYERSRGGGVYVIFWRNEKQYRILAASVPYYLTRKEGTKSLFGYSNMQPVEPDEPTPAELDAPAPQLPAMAPVCQDTIIQCMQDAYHRLLHGDHAGACWEAERFREHPHVVGYISAAITGLHRAMEGGDDG